MPGSRRETLRKPTYWAGVLLAVAITVGIWQAPILTGWAAIVPLLGWVCAGALVGLPLTREPKSGPPYERRQGGVR